MVLLGHTARARCKTRGGGSAVDSPITNRPPHSRPLARVLLRCMPLLPA
jgi:hypothetical protein